jgi:crotonobetainyl-CoA hydratase
MATVRELAGSLAAGPPLVFAAIKEVARESERLSFADAIERVVRKEFPTVASLYGSEDQLEGARAFAERRAPVWKGR